MARKATAKDGIVRRETFITEEVNKAIEENIASKANTSFQDVNKNLLAALSKSNIQTYYKVLSMLANPETEETK